MVLVITYALSLGYALFVVRRRNFEQYLLVWMLAILIFGYLTFNWLVGGDWMIGWRFVAPILPFVVLTIGFALLHVKPAFAVFALVGVVSSLAFQASSLHEVSIRQANSDKGDILMGQYIHRMNLAPDSKIAVIDAGAILYYAGLLTIDMIGLNDSYLSSLPGGFLQKYDNKYVLDNKPSVIQFHTRYISDNSDVAPTEAFLGATRLFYSREFQRWYERDVKSPVPHLFLRRAAPLSETVMDTFFEARITGEYQGGEVKLRLEKLGDGIWVAPSGNHFELGVVYVRVRLMSRSGQVFDERMLPILNNMGKGENVSFNLVLPQSGVSPYKVTACPILAGVQEMESCLNGNAYEYVMFNGQAKLPLGDYRFNDERLVLLGWSGLEAEHVWSLGQDSIIKFDVEDAVAVNYVYLNLMPFGGQRLAIDLNGVEVYQGVLNSPGQVALQVAGTLQNKNELRLRHPDARQVGEHDRRVVAFALKGISLK